MNLAYIYIEKYKHLENIEFNFLPNHKFEFRDGILSHKIEEPIYNLFNNLNLTAIIGENGTGKSTILEFIANYNSSYFSNLGNFVIVTTKDKFKSICSNPIETKFIIHVDKDDFSYYKEFPSLFENIDIQNLGLFSDLEGWESKSLNVMAKTIYYSNILDFTGVNIGKSNQFINISSSYVLNNYHKNYDKVERAKESLDILDSKLITGERASLNDTDRQNLKTIKEYFDGEHDSEAQVVAGYERDTYNEIVKFFVSTLHGIDISPDYNTNENIRKFLNNMNMPKTIEIRFTSFLSDMKYIKEYEKEFVDHLWNLCSWHEKMQYESKKKIILLKFIASSIAISDDKKLIDSFIKNITNVKIIDDLSLEFLKDKENNVSKACLKAFEKIEFLLEHERVRISGNNNNGKLVIDIDDRTKEVGKLKETLFFLIDNVKEVINESKFLIKKQNHSILIFDFDRKLSSGELGLLTYFSRFYKNYLFSLNKEESFIILLDEPEMYLHMEWQRNFIQIFLNFTAIFFQMSKFVNVIFTSHSPFLISDIPRENVIFLKKDKESGRTVINHPTDLENTFAANIHTLVKNGFFMTSTIGEFAKSKIEEVIKIINAREYNKSKENKEFCDYIISIIGEPLIKNKLLSMIEPYETTEDKIKRKKQELEELEEELMNKNDKN